MRFCILDEREVWHGPACKAARDRGYKAGRICRGNEAKGPGIGFIRPHAHPQALERNQLEDWPSMIESGLTMIQDVKQVMYYESKIMQADAFGDWLPETHIFYHHEQALKYAQSCPLPVVSKASEGASSVNVRVIRDRDDLIRHVNQAFGAGIEVAHCDSQGTKSRQHGYVIFQRFIPHDTTYRVNIIGRGRAIFKRFNYPDKPVAQTGNVEAVMAMDGKMESLLEYADKVASGIGTKWAALDILDDGGQWRLLETSLAWPWPGKGGDNPIFRTKRKWSGMWDALFDEVEAGEWADLR
jgi:hypothetical protein